jgi:putative membrane protein
MDGRARFTDERKARIEKAVAEAEASTSGEIVPMVVEASDAYPHAALLAAILFELLALAALPWAVPEPTPLDVAACVAGGLAAGFVLGRWAGPLRRLLIGAKVARTEVHQRAVQAFVEHGLAETRDRTGVLILVSLLERRVEVLADRGIREKVPPETWDDVVARVVRGIRAGRLDDGLIDGIARVGEVLAAHFPPRDDDTNELGDRLLVN